MMRNKSRWLVPLGLALLVGGVGWWADLRLRETIEQELRGNLVTTLNANVTSLEIWMDNQKRLAAALTQEPRFQTLALELLAHSTDGTTNRAATAELARQLIADEHLPERLSALGYGMGQLVGTNLLVVTDTGRRAAWWVAHRKSLIGLQKPPTREVTNLDKTVKIEFAERTP